VAVFIGIEGDMTGWVPASPDDISKLSQPGDTVSLQVTAPLTGTLLLSRKAAASVTVVTLGNSGDVIPGNFKTATPAIYLPSPNGYTASAEGPGGGPIIYQLPSVTNLATLTSNIAAAMSAGSSLSLDFDNGLSSGTLWLNGATLPFVVLCPATPAG
jgi:hypothetical protein